MIRSLPALCACLVLFQSLAARAQPVALVPQEYPTIQAAIDAHPTQVDIRLAAGVYREIVKADSMTLSLAPQAGAEGRVVLSADLNGDGEAEGRFLTNNGAGDARSGVLLTNLRFEAAGIEASTAEIEITGCTFTGGTTDLSRAVTAPLSHVTARDSVFEGIGTVGDGAAILAEVLVAEGSIFRGCSAGGDGGAASFSSGELRGCRFESNSAGDQGGAVRVPIGSDQFAVVIEDCEFIGNAAWQGGALYGQGSVIDCGFTRNRAGSSGGAVWFGETWPGTLAGCVFIENRSLRDSGAVFGAVDIADCRFIGNTARTFGGALGMTAGRITDSIFAENTVSVLPTAQAAAGGAICMETSFDRIEGCLFVGNVGAQGGALFRVQPGGVISRCRFFANIASDYGGAIGAGPLGVREVVSCVFSANAAPIGAALGSSRASFGRVEHCAFFDQIGHAIESEEWSATPSLPTACIFGPGESISLGGRAPAVGPAWSIGDPALIGVGAIPFDPMLARLPDDGGDGWGDDPITPGVDEGANDDFGDLSPRPGSPVIDAAGTVTEEGELDLTGMPRLHDDPGVPTARADIGPVEFRGASCLPDLNADGAVTPADFAAWVGMFSAGDQRADQNRDGLIQPGDFTAWIQNVNTGCT